MVFFDKNLKEKKEFRRVVGGFLGNPKNTSSPVPILQDVVSKEGNIINIKTKEPVKKPVESIKVVNPGLELDAIKELNKDVFRNEPSLVKIISRAPIFKNPVLSGGSGLTGKTRSFYIAGSILFFAVSLVLFSFAFARAKVTLRVKVLTVQFPQTLITVDSKAQAVNVNSKKLPGLYIEVKKSVAKNFDAKTVGYTESRARGVITIFNNFGTSPQVLIKTTRFESKSTGFIYRLQETITVPGATKQGDKMIPGSIRAEVVADEIGEKYNIASDDFVIPAFRGSPRYQGFYAKSQEAFRGGLKGAGALVTAEELQKAEEAVTAEVFEKAKEELNSKIPPGFKLLPGARAIKITKVSKPHTGEAARTFTVAADSTANAILFKEEDLFLLIAKLSIKEGSQESILKQKSDVFKDINQLDFDFDNQILTFNLVSNLVLSYDIDAEKFKNEIGGKLKSEAEAILRNKQELTGHVVEISPFWIKKVPSNPKKIDLIVER